MNAKLIIVSLSLVLVAGCATSKSNTPAPAVAPVAEKKTEAPHAQTASALPGKAEHKAAKTDAAVECTLKKDKRLIAIQAKDPKGCEVEYTKFDKANAVASSKKGSAHCESTSQKIQTHLKAAGFSCQ